MSDRKWEPSGAPGCGACRHWRKSDWPYDHCVKVNVREAWGDCKYMPCGPCDTACSEFEAVA